MELTKDMLDKLRAVIVDVVSEELKKSAAPVAEVKAEVEGEQEGIKELLAKQSEAITSLGEAVKSVISEHDGTREAVSNLAETTGSLVKAVGTQTGRRSLEGEETAAPKVEERKVEKSAEEILSDFEDAMVQALPRDYGGSGLKVNLGVAEA